MVRTASDCSQVDHDALNAAYWFPGTASHHNFGDQYEPMALVTSHSQMLHFRRIFTLRCRQEGIVSSKSCVLILLTPFTCHTFW